VAFRGTFDQKLDAKNRLTIPARFRAPLADGVVIAMPLDGRPCLWVFRADEYDSFSESLLAELSPLSARRMELERTLNGLSRDGELDSAGRVMLAPGQLRHANIEKDVVVVGAGSRLELWDQQRWEQQQVELLRSAEEITRSVDHAG
jgi:MraZ protein